MNFVFIIASFSTLASIIILQASLTGALVPANRDSLGLLKNSMCYATSNKYDEGKETIKSNLKEQEYKRVTWNPLRLLVLKLGFTEPAWTSPLNYGKRDGVFNCAFCGLGLFDTSGYYESGSGWPSFFRSIEDGNVQYKMEWDGRLECQCGRCSSHLGHVFLDGPLPKNVPKVLFETAPPSDPRGRRADGYLPRFCINGASLMFEKREDVNEAN